MLWLLNLNEKGDNMKKICLTGATSMLGIALIKECIKNNIEVLAIVRPNSNNILRLPNSTLINIAPCEISDLLGLNITNNQCDIFYHFGWSGTDKYMRNNPDEQMINIKYTLDAVHLAKKIGCHTFIGAGSQAEYGIINHKISPETLCKPETAYGISKYAAGKLSSLLCKDMKMKHIWARIFSAYGPNDNNETMIMYTIRELLQGRSPSLTKCEQVWDFIYCEDAAKALYLLAERGKNDKIYCIASGEGKPLIEYVETIRDIINPKLPLGIGEKEYSLNQVMNLCADINSLIDETGFSPRISFVEGIKRTIKSEKNKI